jgi:hypothetical protein
MSLKPNDLKNFVSEIFTIDSFKSKMGKDENVAVLAFEVKDREPAKDLTNFIEKGYEFVLDADLSSGENSKGKYDVFVEIERDRHLPRNIQTLLDDVSKVAGIEEWKYRYYKGVESHSFNEDAEIPLNADEYTATIERYRQGELDRFFNRGTTEQKYVKDNVIEFGKHAAGKIRMEEIDEGSVLDITTKYKGAIKLESASMSEVFFLTKFFGNYNIYKIDENFFFTNGVKTKVLKRL